MITRIEALNFRCLRYVSQTLGRFHVLIGPNASGKTTFLDVVAFMGQVVSQGLDVAVAERTQNFQDLVWSREGESFELAIELAIPEPLRQRLRDPSCHTIRYEMALSIAPESHEIGFAAERVFLRASTPEPLASRDLFPRSLLPPKTLLTSKDTTGQGNQLVLNKAPGGNGKFYSETYTAKGEGEIPPFKLGRRRSALANLPEDESKFPASTWLKSLLCDGIQRLVLNSLLIRKASPPGSGKALRPDGSNLPWVIEDLKRRHGDRLEQWIAHLQTALPDLEDIRTVERGDDRHRYLMLRYRGGLEVPSWMASDGTLRLLALTLPAYLPDFTGTYLIEEPENGIHPRAVETMFQSLSSVYDAQLLLATHSPVVLSIVDPKELLCFAKTQEGATDVVLGSEHPALQDWRRQTDLGVLFAAGVLG